MRRIGIYGSSFDPITNVHLWTASTVASRMDLDLVIFVPCSSVRRADDKKMKTQDVHRIEMIELAIDDNPLFKLDRFEVNMDHGIGTTYNTMTHFRDIYPNDELFFIMGADLLKDLPDWREGKDLIEEFQFIVMARDGYDMLKMVATHPMLRNNQRHFHLMDKGLAMEISSTYIRDEFAMGGNPRYLLPDACYNYIVENGLYINPITNKIGAIR